MFLNAAFRPGVSPRVGGSDNFPINRRWAFIKTHNDVRAKIMLNLDRFLRRESVNRTVKVAAKRNTFIIDLTQCSEAKHLKPARIGQHWAIPTHKIVQAAKLMDQVITGTHIEMIGI